MHLHCRFYLQTDSDINFHCRFYLKTGSDINFHCQFYSKTGNDVHTPLYKTNHQPHTSIPPSHELSVSFLTFHSYFSRNPLSLRDLVMAPAFFNGIDMLSSLIFYLYSFDLYLYSCFFAFYIYIYYYSCIRSIFNYVATFYL